MLGSKEFSWASSSGRFDFDGLSRVPFVGAGIVDFGGFGKFANLLFRDFSLVRSRPQPRP